MNIASMPARANAPGRSRVQSAAMHLETFGSLELEGDAVHVWCMASDRPIDLQRQDQIRRLLSPYERERETAFHFPRDRQTFLLTRALVRSALSAYTGIAPESLRLRASEKGKPELVVDNCDAEGVSFNVSHTDGLIALAITRHGAVGIDTEKIGGRSASLDIAEQFFAPMEVADLRTAQAAEVDFRFFRYWTLKEAYLKARGVGLSAPMDEFAFRLDASPVEISLQAARGDTASDWKIWQLTTADHLLAVCAERTPGCILRLLVRSVDSDWNCSGTTMELIGESDIE